MASLPNTAWVGIRADDAATKALTLSDPSINLDHLSTLERYPSHPFSKKFDIVLASEKNMIKEKIVEGDIVVLESTFELVTIPCEDREVSVQVHHDKRNNYKGARGKSCDKWIIVSKSPIGCSCSQCNMLVGVGGWSS